MDIHVLGVVNTQQCFRTHAKCRDMATIQCTSGIHLLCDECNESNDIQIKHNNNSNRIHNYATIYTRNLMK